MADAPYRGQDHRGRAIHQVPEYLAELARGLRRKETPAEEILWECLRDRRLMGVKFRRQHVIDRFVADFYCHEARLVVEVDGSVHGRVRQREYDELRDEELRSQGFRVLRISNATVDRNPIEALQEIMAAIDGCRRT